MCWLRTKWLKESPALILMIYWWTRQEVITERVREHVNTYGLTAKPTEALEDRMALDLKLRQNKEGKLVFGRGSEIPEVQSGLTKQKLFSVCGKLVGHYPIVR